LLAGKVVENEFRHVNRMGVQLAFWSPVREVDLGVWSLTCGAYIPRHLGAKEG
jgi:hypothetical protein